MLSAQASKIHLSSKKLTPIQVDSFDGVNVLLSVTRLKKNEARDATNMMLIEDGVWTKRWGTKTQITMGATVDGFTEYVKSDLTRLLIVVAGGTVYKSSDMATTTGLSMSGITLTSGKTCYFVQIGSYLYITNGTDPIIRFDGTTLTQYTGLASIGSVSSSLTGLSSGTINAYYKVTAVNAVGEGAPSAEVTVSVNKIRTLWSTSNAVNLTWTAVTNATAYVVYYADIGGFEGKLAVVTTNAFTDDGSLIANPYIGPPDADSTTGPKLSFTWISGDRIWGVDPNFPWRVWFSGTDVRIGNFNTVYGGGWLEIEKGGRATPIGGQEFQGHCMILAQTPDGLGNLWQVDLLSQSVSGASTSYIVPVPTKVIGRVGCTSPLSIILVENDLWFNNPYGEYVAGNEPNFYNLVRSNEISVKLRPYMQTLNSANIGNVCAFYYKAKVFISVPTQAGANNRIIVYDRERLAWDKDWTIGVSRFGTFTTTDNMTHFLGSTGAKIIEFSQAYPDDDGVPFSWQYQSPQIPIDTQWTQFMKVKKAYVRLRNVQGNINFSFSGTRKLKAYSTLGTAVINQGISDTGIGWDMIGTVAIGSTSGKPTTFSVESLIKFMKINKLLRDYQFTISGSATNDQATITGIMIKGFLISAGDPATWKLTPSS